MLFFTEKYKLINVKGMMGLECCYFITPNVIINSSKYHQWMLKSLAKEGHGSQVSSPALRLDWTLNGIYTFVIERYDYRHLNQGITLSTINSGTFWHCAWYTAIWSTRRHSWSYLAKNDLKLPKALALISGDTVNREKKKN